MTQLIDNTPIDVTRGQHQVTVRLNGGTAKLQYSVEGISMADLPDSTYAADADEIKTLCSCKFQAVLTGSAVAYLNVIRFYP